MKAAFGVQLVIAWPVTWFFDVLFVFFEPYLGSALKVFCFFLRFSRPPDAGRNLAKNAKNQKKVFGGPRKPGQVTVDPSEN
mgnify:CR=1 FL=1